MALKKKIQSSLLVATIVAGGLYIGMENASLAKENQSLQNQVQDTNNKLKKQESENKELDKKIKESTEELENTKQNLEKVQSNLEETQTNLDNTKKELDSTKTKLQKAEEQLQAKQTSAAVATASVSNSLARPSDVNTSSSTNTTASKGTPIKITMTFYGSNIDGMTDMTASGKKIAAGMVASNYYPFGTKFEYNGQIYTVMDRGGKGLNGPNNLDVYVPRKAGESDSQYRARLYQLGRQTVTMNKL